MSGEKTEKPTPKKLKEARKKGQVARTQELGAWSALLLVASFSPMLIGKESQQIQLLIERCLAAIQDPTVPVALQLLGQGLFQAALAIVLFGSMIMVVGVASALAQGGFFLSTSSVKPKLSKLNPVQGLKKVFGPHGLWEAGKMLLKTSVVGLFAYLTIRSLVPMVGGDPMSIESVLGAVRGKAVGLLREVAVVSLVMAAADYAMARRRIGKQVKMSKQEIKDEHKQSEGDPLVKSAIRSRQMAIARNRMLADVKNADVVMVNPTHVAVALTYDRDKGAPRVVAKGAGVIASKIRAAADMHRVPMVRDVPLARALYGSCEIGQEIPAELFAAVAQVLAFVITRRTQGRRGGEHTSPRAGELPAVARRTRTGRALPGTVATAGPPNPSDPH